MKVWRVASLENSTGQDHDYDFPGTAILPAEAVQSGRSVFRSERNLKWFEVVSLNKSS